MTDQHFNIIRILLCLIIAFLFGIWLWWTRKPG